MGESLKAILFEPPKNTGFGIGFIAMLLIVIAIVFPLYYNLTDPDGQLTHFTQMLYGGLIGTILMSIALYELNRKRKATDADLIIIGVQSTYKQAMVFATGVFVGVLAIIVNIFISIEGENILLGSVFGSISPKSFYLGLLAGVAEELLFRGFIQTFLELALGGTLFARFLAAFPTAFIFSLFHYAAYPGDMVAFWALFGIGLVFGMIHAISNDIGSPMVAHIINNLFAMLPAVGAALLDNIIIIIVIAVLSFFAFMVGLAGMKKRGG